MKRIVVVGNGMVGSRFAEELAALDDDGRYRITVLGAEDHEAYNRVLLSDFVAGKTTAGGLSMPAPSAHQVEVRRGSRVVAIDRAESTVSTADGVSVRYDALVLATGARARVLPLTGLPSEGLMPGAHVLRTIDDAREIVAAAANAKSAIVIGGGVLGLETATGLAKRNVAVTLVHAADAVMERQLDPETSRVAVAALAIAGVASELSATSQAVATEDGRVRGLILGDGRTLPCDLLVMACGTEPDTALAVAAGLSCDRGIVVGSDLASVDDPTIYAIGDCAAPPEGGTGLIAQGWDQARRLAQVLARGQSAEPAADEGRTDVVRVKGAGLDIVAMGRSGARLAAGSGCRTLRLNDPDAMRSIEVVIADGRLVGATCVGAGSVAADLTATYLRGTPVPVDPAQLLIRLPLGTASETGSPTTMPERFTVCRCNGVSKRDIMRSWSKGARTRAEVAASTRATTGCGGCTDVVEGIVDWLRASDPDPSAAQPAAPARANELTGAKHSSYRLETSTS